MLDPKILLWKSGLVVTGALLYTILQAVQYKQSKASVELRVHFFDFFSAAFTGVLCGLGAIGLSSEEGVAFALYGAGALLGPRGFDKILTVVARK